MPNQHGKPDQFKGADPLHPPEIPHDVGRSRGVIEKIFGWLGIFKFGGQGRESKTDQRDIVILVMGPTGVGKSTFINTVLNQPDAMPVGNDYESCTVKITPAEISMSHLVKVYPWLRNRRLYLIDTPGFDDPDKEDLDIVKDIASWLNKSYRTQVLGGVVYLHDLSVDRFNGGARKTLSLFNKLCGQGSLSKVALGTTKSDRVPQEASRRLDRLKQIHWKNMVDKRAQVFVFDRDHTTALNSIKAILNRFGE